MDGAALFLLGLRMRSRLLRPLLVFQLLFLLCMGLIVVYYYGESKSGGTEPNVAVTLMSSLSAINGAVYCSIILLIRRLAPPSIRRSVHLIIAEILAGIVVAKSIANIVVLTGAHTGNSLAVTIGGAPFWNLGGHLFSAAAMIAFGLLIRSKFSSNETNAVRRLIKAFGLSARETEIAILTARGLSNKDCSGIIYLSCYSMDPYLQSLPEDKCRE